MRESKRERSEREEREREEREREEREGERERVRESKREKRVRGGFSTVSVCRQEQWWQHTIHYNICIFRKTLQCH